jgi:hypothetical protein
MRRRRRDLHTVLVPAGVLFVAFVALLLTSRETDQRIMLVQMATGTAVLASAWLLLESRLDRISMAAEGFEGNVEKLRGEIRKVSERLEDVERIPPIRKLLEAQAAQRERERIGGLDTPQPGDPMMPEFPPEPFTRSPAR